MKTRIIIAGLAAILFSGCTSLSYQSPDGTKVSAVSVLNKRSISKASFDPKTGKLVVEGYASEQTEQLAAVAAAVAQAVTAAK